VAVTDEKVFRELVRQAFGQRRKTLRNTLRTLLDADEISAAGIDPGARAETLDLAGFAALANRVADS
jgi:16S rRNA (adenine1518-N6/adenine1519-N6)-dimethyltransferase